MGILGRDDACVAINASKSSPSSPAEAPADCHVLLSPASPACAHNHTMPFGAPKPWRAHDRSHIAAIGQRFIRQLLTFHRVACAHATTEHVMPDTQRHARHTTSCPIHNVMPEHVMPDTQHSTCQGGNRGGAKHKPSAYILAMRHHIRCIVRVLNDHCAAWLHAWSIVMMTTVS